MDEGNSPSRDRACVFIVEDHPIARHGLSQLIGSQPDMAVCGESESVAGTVDRLAEAHPDVILVDLDLKDGSGIDLLERIGRQWIGMKMIVVSTHDARTHGPIARRAGAAGYINKHQAIDLILDAIRSVLMGGVFFVT